MSIEVSLNCPACGGAVKAQEGRTALNCQYCGSALFLEGDAGVITIAFKNKMDRERASSLSQGWFRKGWKARDLATKGKVLEAYPIYLPFWMTRMRVLGWICGYEERQRSDSKGNTRTERIPKEEMVLHDYPLSEIACDPGDLGIKRLRNFSGESGLEDFTMIPTYEATTSKDQALDRMKAEAVTNARRDSGVPHITFERLHVLPRAMSMVYYPIWVVRYSYNENMYFYTMDGVTGEVISGRAPGDYSIPVARHHRRHIHRGDNGRAGHRLWGGRVRPGRCGHRRRPSSSSPIPSSDMGRRSYKGTSTTRSTGFRP